MAQNRIQFQPGLNLTDFFEYFGTEEQCEAALEQNRWPNGFICPRCQSHSHCIVWHNKTKTFQCSVCRAQVTLTGGTIFHATKLPLTKWFQAIYFMSQTKNNRAHGTGYS